MSDKIKNPLTGRSIKIDGPTHKKLIKDGVLDKNGNDIRRKSVEKSFKKSSSKKSSSKKTSSKKSTEKPKKKHKRKSTGKMDEESRKLYEQGKKDIEEANKKFQKESVIEMMKKKQTEKEFTDELLKRFFRV